MLEITGLMELIVESVLNVTPLVPLVTVLLMVIVLNVTLVYT
jgi:hypothetical protein